MQKLNKDLPYGQIFGDTKDDACFKQGNVRFDAEGNPVPGQTGVDYSVADATVDPVVMADATVDASVMADAGTIDVSPEEATLTAVSTEDPDDHVPDGIKYEELAASEIKKMVQDAGGEYVNRDQGIDYLKSAA